MQHHGHTEAVLFAALAARHRPPSTSQPFGIPESGGLPAQRGAQFLARSGQVGKQRHDEEADEQCANDPKVHASLIARIGPNVSCEPN